MQNEKSLKIAISIWTFTPNTGGLQSHTENLCKHLLRRGHSVQVITRSATRVPVFDDYLFFNETSDEILVDGIPVRPICFSRAWSPVLWLILKTAARPACVRLAARLYEMVAARPTNAAFSGFDIIHHVGHATALVGLAAARSAKKWKTPFVVQPTAHPVHFGDSVLDLQLYRLADRLLVHTYYERDYFNSKDIQCPKDVVYCGLEDRTDGQGDRFRAKYNINGSIILFLGRKSEDKGHPLVIDAFKLVQQKHPNATLVCIGPTVSNSRNERNSGVLEIDFVSEDEKHDALAACSFLCVPSVGESFGLVYMEASRYGKPSIARNVPVLRELLGLKKAALLIGHPDDQTNSAKLGAEELAVAIQDLLENPALCREIGAEAFKVSGSFLWPSVVRRFESAYYAALNDSPAKQKLSHG